MRVERIAAEIGLDVGELRRFSSISVDVMRGFKRAIVDSPNAGSLFWSGYARYEDMLAVNKVICSIKSPMGDFGAASHNQLTFYMIKLRESNTLREFFGWYSSQLQPHRNFDIVFKFLRACEYGLGEYYALVEALVNATWDGRANYALFIADIANLFRPECVKVLDERGVPMQISERFYQHADTTEMLSDRLLAYARAGNRMMSEFEQAWVVEALSL